MTMVTKYIFRLHIFKKLTLISGHFFHDIPIDRRDENYRLGDTNNSKYVKLSLIILISN